MARKKVYMGEGWWVLCYPNQHKYLAGREQWNGEIRTYKRVFSTLDEARNFVDDCRIEESYLEWKYGKLED